ncbi:HigA family addiction module antitoxin [Pontiella sulfatireligans]|uniref:HigA family addiction module antitoxin n=1 Tax=Pontiella sulfatireligans TaxID=2750658 RepID=UPI0038B4A265
MFGGGLLEKAAGVPVAVDVAPENNLAVSPRRINEIVYGKRSVTADTALRLSVYFGNSASFWLGLQMDCDLDVAEDTVADKIHKEVHQLAVV